MHRRLGRATLSQLAFPKETNTNFPWNKSQQDNTVWLHKVQQLSRYCPDAQSLEFWTSLVSLTLTTSEQFNQTKFSSKRISSSEDIQKVIFWLYDPSVWPWPCRQKINLFRRQSGSWWRITIPSLVVKESTNQKISSGQNSWIFGVFFFCCDVDLQNSKPIFLHDTPAHNDASQHQVW